MKASEYLQYLMDRAGDNPNSLSRKSNVPQPTIFRFLSGTAKEPRLSTLEKLARAYNVPVDVFLKRDARLLAIQQENTPGSELEYVKAPTGSTLIPVIGTAEMGVNGWYDDQEPGSEGFISHFSNDKDAYALKVTGDSMYPAIRSGWFVVVEPNSPPPTGGEFVSIHIKTDTDEKKLVKEYLFRSGNEVHLQSVNQSQRLTVPVADIVSMHPIAAVVSPRKHKFFPT